MLLLLLACSCAAADVLTRRAADSASSYEAAIENSAGIESPAGAEGLARRRDAAKKDGSALLKKGKELIRKNTELIKTMEKEFRKIKEEKTGLGAPAKTAANSVLETKITVPASASEAAGQGSTLPISPTPGGSPIKKLTDLFFKSALVTKNEILSKEDSAALIESSNKIRSIIQQLQKIYDAQIGILRTFLDGKENPGIAYEQNEKPKDVMKYQVIEVTEKKK